MPEGTGLLTFAEAAELAVSESDEATSDDSATDLPSEEETQVEEDGQAEDEETEEQPETDGDTEASSDADEDEDEGSNPEDESLFSDLDDEEEATAPDLVAEIAAELGVEASTIDDLRAHLQEVKEAGLRQSDYTRKTQKLAEDRKAWESENAQATRFYETLKRDPLGFFGALASELGVDIDVQGAKNPGFKLTGQEDIEAMVEERVAERLQSDPEIVEAKRIAALKAVDDAFEFIENKNSVKLAASDRQKMLRYAQEKGITDLEAVFDVFSARAAKAREAKAARTEQTKKTSTKRSQGRVPEQDVASKPATVEEALNRALAGLGA